MPTLPMTCMQGSLRVFLSDDEPSFGLQRNAALMCRASCQTFHGWKLQIHLLVALTH